MYLRLNKLNNWVMMFLENLLNHLSIKAYNCPFSSKAKKYNSVLNVCEDIIM